MSRRTLRSPLRYERLPLHEDDDSLDACPLLDKSEDDRLRVAAPWIVRLGHRLPLVNRFTTRSVYAHYLTPRRKKRSILRCIYWTVFCFPYACLFLVIVASLCFPSYTHRPPHYVQLRQRAEQSREPGRANINNEKVFIAASIYEKEGALTSGAWGQSMTELVDLLGPDNVHVSLYENDADAISKESLVRFKQLLPCMSPFARQPMGVTCPTTNTFNACTPTNKN